MFWFFSILMALLAISFIIVPLLRKTVLSAPGQNELNAAIYRQKLDELEKEFEQGEIDQAQYDSTRSEIENQVLDDVGQTNSASAPIKTGNSKWLAIGAGITLPLVAFIFYFSLGNPRFLGDMSEQTENQRTMPNQAMIEGMVAKLAARLKENPKDGEGWMKLGRSYLVLERYTDAVKAYENAYGILGDDPDLLAIYAEALATIHSNNLTGKPITLIKKALKIDPNHTRSLWLAGHAALQKKDLATAKKYWRRLLKQLPAGSQEAATVEQFIKSAGAAE